MVADVAVHWDVVVVSGELTWRSAADVRDALNAAIDAGTGDLVVDLQAVSLVDATGLGLLVGAHRRAGRSGRRLVLRRVPAGLGRMLVMTRLHRILAVESPGQRG